MKNRPREPIIPELLFPPFNKTSEPLTVSEVAALIRKHPRTVCRYARMGIIPGARQDFGKGGGWRWWTAEGGK